MFIFDFSLDTETLNFKVFLDLIVGLGTWPSFLTNELFDCLYCCVINKQFFFLNTLRANNFL